MFNLFLVVEIFKVIVKKYMFNISDINIKNNKKDCTT